MVRALSMHKRESIFQNFLTKGKDPIPNVTIYQKPTQCPLASYKYYQKPMYVKIGGHNLSKPNKLIMERNIFQ